MCNGRAILIAGVFEESIDSVRLGADFRPAASGLPHMSSNPSSHARLQFCVRRDHPHHGVEPDLDDVDHRAQDYTPEVSQRMAFYSSVLIASLSILPPTQAPTLGPRDTLDELKSVRVSLERLEKGQNQLIVLARIQIDESRIATLEAQRQSLLEREPQLAEEVGRLGIMVKQAASGVMTLVEATPDGPESMVVAKPDNVAARHAEAARQLDEARSGLRTLDQAITGLRTRIATWEKRFEEISR
jgi:hypothetical protein